MKILLINPPIRNAARFAGPNSTWLHHELAPPLGLMSLSAYIKTVGFDEIELLNGQTPSGLTDGQIVSKLRHFQPDVVGITAYFHILYSVRRITRLVKATLPRSRVVLGGPHLTVYGEESVAWPEVDFGVVGEGEYTFAELLHSLQAGSDPGDVTGLIWKRGDEVVRNQPRVINRSLDDLPTPDFSLFDMKQHRIPYDDDHPSAVIISSRGCPYRCSFCSRNYPYYRARSPDSVVNEMISYKEMGYRAVSFYDETFNASRSRVMEICRLLQENRLDLHWSFRGRVDRFDDEMASAMSQAGCTRAHFGVESGTTEILKTVQKDFTLDQVRKAFATCRRHGINTVAFFILGLPGETSEQAQKTLDFALELDPDYVVFLSLIPEPGSQIYKDALAAGAFTDYCRDFALDPVADFTFRSWETGMTEAEVFNLMLKGLSSIYLRPGYIFRRLRRVRNIEDFRIKAAMGLRLVLRMGRSWLETT